MTIYFSGHTFKYEIEGVCKLFFPLVRFSHVFELDSMPDGDFVFTRRKKGKDHTLLWIGVSLNGETRRAHTRVSNMADRYENECERLLCVLLYQIFSEWLHIFPKWGILTGVRPVNIIQKERAAGKTDEDIRQFFREKYLVSPEKLGLAFQTADNQLPILKSLRPGSYSLYIAIPFCKSRCSYCSFVSHAITTKKATDKIDEYVELLCRELAVTAKLSNELGLVLDTIYIGGGTPTALSPQQLFKVTNAVSANFDVKSAREYTIEAGRADTISKEKLQIIAQSGAGRISINPQTFNDNVLKEIGRRHTSADVLKAYREARQVGFPAINMDFIAGLPGDTLESFRDTIDRAIAMAPENITVHTLTVKRSAALFWDEEKRRRLQSGLTAAMTEYAQKVLIEAGYRPYYLYRQKNTVGNLENVGYALPGTESCYNVYIMDEDQTILACGAGGVTKIVGEGENPIHRVFNFKYHFEYIDRFDKIIDRKKQVKEYYAGSK